jgi:hypothetical protein
VNSALPAPTAERRGALIAWARDRGALIVEDDYDVEYRFGRDPVASLQGLAPDLVAFVGTASKTLAPALRLAWVVPPSHLIDDVEDVLLVTGVTPPTLDQVAWRRSSRTPRWNASCAPCGPDAPASACMSCTATSPRTLRPLRRSSSASPSRANRT